MHSKVDWKAKEADQLYAEFGKKLSTLSDDLVENHREYIVNPIAFDSFINLHIAQLWDAQSTTRALVGKSFFEKLAK